MIISSILMTMVSLFFCVILIKLITAPIRLIFKLLLNALLGFFILLIFNFISGFFDFSISMSFTNCVIAGIFGVPGVIVLTLLTILF